LLAGTAEFLSKEFGLPVPAWVDEPEFLLPDLWELDGWMLPDDPAAIERRKAKAEPCFLRRNVLLERRDLITL
jgi:hypothetical protein